MCINDVRVRYRPEGTQEGSRMMYTVDNTTATTATLANLQCNTKYIVLVYAHGRQDGITSVSRMAFLPARGMSIVHWQVVGHVVYLISHSCHVHVHLT